MLNTGIPFVGHRWNRFDAVSVINVEQEFWCNRGDVAATEFFGVVILQGNHTELPSVSLITPEWWAPRNFPIGVPTPFPPSVLFFHEKIIAAKPISDSAVYAFWTRFVELDLLALFSAT